MKNKITLSGGSAEKRRQGLTLADLNAFTQAALAQGIDPRVSVQVRVGWRSQLTEIHAEGDRLDD
jgi:hypothetical protein